MHTPPDGRRHRGFLPAVALAAAAGGALVAVHHHRLGLTLSHYDARGHLVVARRIFDSITPGWQQIGAVWLPLPHLLNAIPVQVDFLYRTGLFAVLLSIASFALAAASIARMIRSLTGSESAALAGTAVFAFNPNVLYLQATPMSEPLLFGLLTLAVALLIDWTMEAPARPSGIAQETDMAGKAGGHACGPIGWAFAFACLTRYEAWPVTMAALAAAAWARWRGGRSLTDSVRETAAIAVYPAVAIVAFMIFSRIVVGQWFVSSGFFVPDNPAWGHPVVALSEIFWGARVMSGYGLVLVATLGLAVLAVGGLADRRRGAWLIAVTLVATAAVPWVAFVMGHPYRIRYMVPLMVGQAVGAGFAAGVLPRARLAAVIALLAITAIELRPLDPKAPMVLEAQWDLPSAVERRHVSACLQQGYHGETVMASMGSLGHYMQDLSNQGFAIRDFLHEGNGDIWLNALRHPRPYAGWILIEEKAEGGDMLAEIARARPTFLDGFTRVCEGAGVALYRRTDRPAANDADAQP